MTSRPAPSARQASHKTADAADRLLDWLKQQGGLPDGSGDSQPEPGHAADGVAEAPSPNPPTPPIPAKCEAFAREDALRGLGEGLGQEREVGRSLARRAERTDAATRAAPPLRPAHTDWLHHRLLVAGPAGKLADFQAAACGAGTIPWRLDLDRMEEDLFLVLASPSPPQRRRLSLAAARASLPASSALLRSGVTPQRWPMWNRVSPKSEAFAAGFAPSTCMRSCRCPRAC